MQRRAAQLLLWLRRFEVSVALGAFALLIVVVFADVLMRRVTGSGILWSREVGIFANIWLTMLAIGIASASGAHLRPRFLDRIFPSRWDAFLSRLQQALTAVGFGALAAIAVAVVRETFALDDRSDVLRLSKGVLQICMPVAFALAGVRHAVFAFWPALQPQEQTEADEAARP
jgi:TRAP-type C4-dicarboxylate transport system permease small subunit